MSGLRLLPPNEVGGATTASASKTTRPRKKRQPKDASLAWEAFEKLVRRSMEIMIGSKELTETLLLTKSVDCIADRLDRTLPDNSPNGNLRRAIVLSGGARCDVQREVVKILLFLASNHLIMDEPYHYEAYINDARAFVDVFSFSGLAEPNMLARIVGISIGSPTMTAVLDLLYEAAVVTESVDLVVKLLRADNRISPQRPGFEHLSALELAVLNGSLAFVDRLLQVGANPNHSSHTGYSTIALAMLNASDDASVQIVRMLLENGAVVKKDNGDVALHLAIWKNSFQLIDQLHAAGMDFASTCPLPHITRNPGINSRTIKIEFIWLEDNLYDATCLDLAASFLSENFAWQGSRSLDEGVDDEETSLKLVEYVLTHAGPEFDVDGKLKSEAIVFAAMRGYTKVISYLYQKGGRIDQRKNGFMFPIYAAVNSVQIEACRLLLELGGSARAEYRQIPNDDGVMRSVQVSPLHIAIGYNSIDLVDLLIHSGIDINLPCEVSTTSRYIGDGFWRLADRTEKKPLGCFSPLNLAMVLGFWEVSLLLVDFGATFESNNLFQAASTGQHQLVSRLLELKADPNATVSNNQTALQASTRNGHESVTFKLLESGARVEYETLGLALQYGQHRTAMKLIYNGSNLTGQELAWAFRIPNELMVRSLLQSQISTILASEHSPDGRNFLENAILSGDIAVIRLALSLNDYAYDSGALCAAVLATTQPGLAGMDEIIRELIRRRKLANHLSFCFDNELESTAVSIAACYGREDIVAQIHREGIREINVAVLPEPTVWVWPKPDEHFWDKDIGCSASRYLRKGIGHDTPDISILSNCCHISLCSLRQWSNWHIGDRWLVSPIFLAIKSRRERTIGALLDLGYRADGHSLNAAIFEDFSHELMKRLIYGCTDINASEAIGTMIPHTPVLLAALFKGLDLVKILLDAGADPNAGPWQVRAHTLRYLIKSRRFDFLDVLLQHGIDVNVPSIRTFDDTALQSAALGGDLGTMRRLLEHGAELNARRAMSMGFTAVEAAAACGRLDALRLLLDSGLVTDGFGRYSYVLAIYIAKRAGHSAVVSLLKSHRRWTDWDERTMQEIKQNYFKGKIIINRSEYTEDEMDMVLDLVHGFGEEEFQVLGTSSVGGGQLRLDDDLEYLSEEYEELMNKGEEPGTADTSRELSLIDSSTVIIDSSEDMHNGDGDQIAVMEDPNCQGELSSSLIHEETILGGEAEGPEMKSIIPVANFGPAEEQLEKNPLGLCYEVREESERYQEILDDILGEREAPFHAIEWTW